MEPIVGIDLGTTNSEIAFLINGNAEVLKDNDNGIVPSCVGINSDGKVIVGHEARNQALIAPDRTVVSIKRLMGTDQKIKLLDKNYLPQEISSIILRSLKERAEKVLQQTISKAIITVPAYFTDAQRQATREAGEIAGLNVVRIINEPTAAALAYESTTTESQIILIYDLGGGTFDVSIVKIENGVVEVLSSTGDNHLGGDDFDKKIMDRLFEYCISDLKFDPRKDINVVARFRRASENAKISLSSNPYVTIEEDHIGKQGSKDIHLVYELSRSEFEKMISDDIDRTMDSVTKALQDASILPSDIDKIILVGGSTRIPMISDMLEQKLGKLPHGEIDPDLCVALGASIQAGREMGIDSSKILLDITPYTFGTSALGEIDGIPTRTKFVPIIRRNSKIPTSKSELFFTLYDNQDAVDVTVYQGENPDAIDNVLIGQYLFNLTPSRANSEIILNFNLDLNGILKVEAIEKITGKKVNFVIENAFSVFSQDQISKVREKIDSIWQDQDEFEIDEFEEDDELELENELKNDELENDKPENGELENDLSGKISNEFMQTIVKAQKQSKNAAPEDQQEITRLIEAIKTAIAEKNEDMASQAKSELEEVLFYIES